MYKLIIALMLLSFSLNAQPVGKRLKFKSGVERCLDALGDPIENCFIMSGANGEFQTTTIEEMLEELNIANESAVDSIYTSNDTLYVVYFDAPTLAYKAMGLNGLYSASNNNKTFGVYLANIGVSGLKIQRTGGTFGFEMAVSTNQTQFFGGTAPIRTNNQMEFTGGGRIWRAGSSGATYSINDATMGGVPSRFRITTGSSLITMELRSDGDVGLGNYTSARTLDTSPTNFAGFNTSGVLKKYDLQDIIDMIGSENIGNADLTLTGDRILDGDGGYNFTMQEMDHIFMYTFNSVRMQDQNGAYMGISVGSPYMKSSAGDYYFGDAGLENGVLPDRNNSQTLAITADSVSGKWHTTKISNNYSTSEQVYYGQTWFGETIYWRTWIFDNGINDLEDLTGLTDAIVDHVVKVEASNNSIVSGSWGSFSPELEVNAGQFQTTTSVESDMWVTVYYTK